MNPEIARSFLVEGTRVSELVGANAGASTGVGSGVDLATALPVLAVAGATAGLRYVAGGSWLVSSLGGVVLALVAGAVLGCRICGVPGTIGSIRCGVPCGGV